MRFTSLASTVKVKEPAVLGVPDISPVALLRLKPSGNLPETWGWPHSSQKTRPGFRQNEKRESAQKQS